MGAKIAGPQIAKLFPVRRGAGAHAAIDPLAGGIDGGVVAAGHRPAGQIVFALLFHRHRTGGAFQPERRIIRQQRQCPRRRLQRRGHGGEGLFQPLPFAVLRQFLFGAETSGTEIENLRVAGIKAQSAGTVARPARDEFAIGVQFDVAMHETLQLLEQGGVAPDQGDAAAVRA